MRTFADRHHTASPIASSSHSRSPSGAAGSNVRSAITAASVSPSGAIESVTTQPSSRVAQIRDYIAHWNADARPLTWTATTEEILAKVALTQTNIRKLVDNNAK
jgi:hypothetical protein